MPEEAILTTEVLTRHTDRFCLYKNARTGRQNGRNYLLTAVKAMIESAQTQEGIRLGELYGYYGHNRRMLTGRLDVPETAVVMVEGKPVVLDNVPGCRTIELSVDDDGVVTHTQEIFNNEPGRIIAGLLESRAGGWSWATSGKDSPSVSIPTAFFGFDYVTTPNFVSLDHPAYMNESAEERDAKLLEGLQAKGFSEAAANDVKAHYIRLSEYETTQASVLRAEESEVALLEARGRIIELEQQATQAATSLEEHTGMLESLRTAHAEEVAALQQQLQNSTGQLDARREYVDKMLESLPVFVSPRQREAMLKLETEDDLEAVTGLFEAIRKASLHALPFDRSRAPEMKSARPQTEDQPIITFHSDRPYF